MAHELVALPTQQERQVPWLIDMQLRAGLSFEAGGRRV